MSGGLCSAAYSAYTTQRRHGCFLGFDSWGWGCRMVENSCLHRLVSCWSPLHFAREYVIVSFRLCLCVCLSVCRNRKTAAFSSIDRIGKFRGWWYSINFSSYPQFPQILPYWGLWNCDAIHQGAPPRRAEGDLQRLPACVTYLSVIFRFLPVNMSIFMFLSSLSYCAYMGHSMPEIKVMITVMIIMMMIMS